MNTPFQKLASIRDNLPKSNRGFGKVKWFDKDKGFGFIKSGDDEVFVHYSEISEKPKILKENDNVSFIIAQSDKGKRALEVKKEK